MGFFSFFVCAQTSPIRARAPTPSALDPEGAHSSLLNQGPRNPSPRPAHLCTHSSLGVLLPVRTRRGRSSPQLSALVGLGEEPSHVQTGSFSEVCRLNLEVCGRRVAPGQLRVKRPETLSLWSALGPSLRPPGDNLEQPFPLWGAGPHRGQED